MKKILIMITVLLLVAGCGLKPNELANRAIPKMKEMNNYKINMNMSLAVDMEGSSMSFSFKGNSNIDNKNKVIYNETIFSLMGQENKVVEYIDTNNNNIIKYKLDEGKWYKEVITKANVINFEKLMEASEFTLESKEKGISIIKIKMTKEQIMNLINLDEEALANFKNEVSIEDTYIFLTISKNNYITKMTLEIPAKKDNVTLKINLELEFTDFDQLDDITIPTEVIIDAVDLKVSELEGYAQDYKESAEYDTWGDEKLENDLYTNINLDYDGPKPSKVELQMIDGYVNNGYIEIEGYKAIFENGELISFELINKI